MHRTFLRYNGVSLCLGSAGDSDGGISLLLLRDQLPMIIRCGYEGQLISNRMISVAVRPVDPAASASSSAKLSGEEKLQTKIEFKFY